MSISIWIQHCGIEEKEYIPFLTDGLYKKYWQPITDVHDLQYVTLTWLSSLIIVPNEVDTIKAILSDFETLQHHMARQFPADDPQFSFTLEKTNYLTNLIQSIIASGDCYDRIYIG